MLIKMKNLIFGVLYILIIIYLLIFIPCLWGHKPLVVISGSMEPTLKVGGILYYEEIDLDDFKADDILVYKTKKHIISHRIVDIVDEGFITKGDANNSIDNNLVNKNQVLGKGTNWSIPYLGYYADFIYTHKYLLYIAI
ncbi:MAG: signal peptidase I, partial [Bacilli bacterium]